MRSITTALGTAVLGATIALAAPAAHAATMSPSFGWDCKQNIVTANKAESAYSDALADYKKTIKAGGHPGAAEQANLEALKKAAHDATDDALHSCRPDRDHRRPHGFIHTGIGSTSQGSNTVDIAAGAGLITAVGIGVVALRRRHSGSQV
jgi:hypothetical protein